MALTFSFSSSKASLLGDANFPQSLPDYVKGKKIKLYEDLYERYSGLALSYPTDRPVAIRGLEMRLLRVLDTNGGHGVFDVYLRRGLLWRRNQENLQRIGFSTAEHNQRGAVPSWSWMAYTGAIQYMNLPLGGVEWNQWDRDVISPWADSNAYNQNGAELRVLVRGILTSVDERGARIYLDEPKFPSRRPFKCVIVGSSKESHQGKGTTYYVLIVTPLATHGENFYERAGAAFLYQHQIAWGEPVIQARVR